MYKIIKTFCGTFLIQNNDMNRRDIDNQKTYLSDNYYYRQKIGGGTFGEVWEVLKYSNNKIYAAKDEKLKHKKKSMVVKESNIYEDLETNGFGEGLPKYYNIIRTSIKNVLILERLGMSLDTLYKTQGKVFTNLQLKLYGKQMVNLIMKVHSFGYLHRDIKPQNFITGLNDPEKLYICDFGLSKKYIRNGEHINITTGKQLIGTARYTSVNIHNGIEPSRRDDIISILYIIIYFYYGSLPWQENNRKIKKEMIALKKKEVSINSLCNKIPRIGNLLKYCNSLEFSQMPDYQYIISEIDEEFSKIK